MSTPQSLRGFATANFFASDIAHAKQWYTEFLGVAPYFERNINGSLAYIEFRLGDYQNELGIITSAYAPHGISAQPTGTILYWHVDDVESTLAKLISMGATEYEGLTKRGDAGFVTASVVDPFGNILGIMYNPHYLEILENRP